MKQLVAIKGLLWFIVAVANKLMCGKHSILFHLCWILTVVLLFLSYKMVSEFFHLDTMRYMTCRVLLFSGGWYKA